MKHSSDKIPTIWRILADTQLTDYVRIK